MWLSGSNRHKHLMVPKSPSAQVRTSLRSDSQIDLHWAAGRPGLFNLVDAHRWADDTGGLQAVDLYPGRQGEED